MENDDKDYHYIDDGLMLSEFLKSVRDKGNNDCAIDTEADSLHCYEERSYV